MPDQTAVDAASVVRNLVRARVNGSRRAAELADETAIGSTGLGLDSIAIVELLLECEAALGVPFPSAVFDGGPLTVRRLIDHAALYPRIARE